MLEEMKDILVVHVSVHKVITGHKYMAFSSVNRLPVLCHQHYITCNHLQLKSWNQVILWYFSLINICKHPAILLATCPVYCRVYPASHPMPAGTGSSTPTTLTTLTPASAP